MRERDGSVSLLSFGRMVVVMPLSGSGCCCSQSNRPRLECAKWGKDGLDLQVVCLSDGRSSGDIFLHTYSVTSDIGLFISAGPSGLEGQTASEARHRPRFAVLGQRARSSEARGFGKLFIFLRSGTSEKSACDERAIMELHIGNSVIRPWDAFSQYLFVFDYRDNFVETTRFCMRDLC